MLVPHPPCIFYNEVELTWKDNTIPGKQMGAISNPKYWDRQA